MSEDNAEHEIAMSPKRTHSVDTSEPDERTIEERITNYSVDELFEEGEMQELKRHVAMALENEPDMRIPEVNQKQDYALNKKLIAVITAKAKDAAQQAAYQYMAKHPESEGLGFQFSGRVFVTSSVKINYTKVFKDMLDCMLNRSAGLTTQKAILDSVKKSTGHRELNANIWTMQLKKFMKAKLIEITNQYGFKVSLAGCSNMSEIRKAIDTYYAKRQAVHKIKLDVAITSDEVIINGTTYNINKVKSGEHVYRRIRLNIGDRRMWLGVYTIKVLCGLPV
jgi:hypothetical protein